MSKTKKSRQDLSFEQSLQNLRSVVAELEGGSLSLDDSLKKYEQGIASLRSCYASLKNAELKISRLISVDQQGHARLTPFDHESTADGALDEAELQAELDEEMTDSGSVEDPSEIDESDSLF